MAHPAVTDDESGRPTLPWTRPEEVEHDPLRGRVRATYRTLDRDDKPHTGAALGRFLRIALAKSENGRNQQIRAFVKRYGLLRSPFSRFEYRKPVIDGPFSTYEERFSEYLELSELLNSTLVIHNTAQEDRRLPAVHVARVMEFIDRHALVPVSLHRLRGIQGDAWHSLRSRVEAPMAHEFPGERGDLRKIWRELQAERVVEVFNLWVSRGQVFPVLIREGKNLRGDQWSGAAWGALAGELQGALMGRSRFGVCAFCNRAYEAKQKRPRQSYSGKPVSLCCGDADCVKAKRREQTARSRAKSRHVPRARARTRVRA